MQVPGGSRKKPQSKPGRKQQVSGSRPREVHQHTVCSEGSDGRNLESVVMRDLMAENPRVCHGEGSDGRNPLVCCGEGSDGRNPPTLLVVGPSFILFFFLPT